MRRDVAKGQLTGSDFFRGSLWICPTGPALDHIQQAIRRVRERCGGPMFVPHITLLGGINMERGQAERCLHALAAGFTPFPIRLGKLHGYDEFYTAFFVHVQENPELLALRRRAEQLFAFSSRIPFEPHVSLHYGDISAAIRNELIAELGSTLDVSFQATSIDLVTAAAGIPIEQWSIKMECGLDVGRAVRAASQPSS